MDIQIMMIAEYIKIVMIILIPFVIVGCIIKIIGRNDAKDPIEITKSVESLQGDKWYNIIGLTAVNYIPLILSFGEISVAYIPIILILIVINKKNTKQDWSFVFLNFNLVVSTYLATKHDITKFMELNPYDTESGAVLSLKTLILPIVILVVTLICVKCKKEISNIGNKVDIYKKEKEDLDNKAEINMLDPYSKILKAFVGEKIRLNRKIKLNFCAAVVGPGWFFYRKAYVVGIIDIIISCIISLAMGAGAFAMFLLHLFCATDVYIWWAKKQVNKIIGENINSSETEKIVSAMQNGGTSAEGIKTYIAVLIVEAFIAVCILFWMLGAITSR